MKPLPADLASLRDNASELTEALVDSLETSARDIDVPVHPRTLEAALMQLLNMLDPIEGGREAPAPSRGDLDTLGEYGLHLLDDLSQLASTLGQTTIAQEFEHLCLPLALWLSRNGGEIRHLAPVVNAVAFRANQTRDPALMAELYTHCGELLDATSPAVEDQVADDPRHPWRLLVLNRAIVATRSHQPEFIECAFDTIVESLPSDAQRFLTEAMEQMTAIDYPDHVREVVHHYFLNHAVPRRLH